MQILLHCLLPGPALQEPTEVLPSSCTERWGRRWKRKQWRGHHWGGPLHFRAIQAINPPHTHLFFKPLLSSSNLKIAGLVLAHQMLMTLAESAVMPMQVLNIYLCKLFKCRFFYFIFFLLGQKAFLLCFGLGFNTNISILHWVEDTSSENNFLNRLRRNEKLNVRNKHIASSLFFISQQHLQFVSWFPNTERNPVLALNGVDILRPTTGEKQPAQVDSRHSSD